MKAVVSFLLLPAILPAWTTTPTPNTIVDSLAMSLLNSNMNQLQSEMYSLVSEVAILKTENADLKATLKTLQQNSGGNVLSMMQTDLQLLQNSNFKLSGDVLTLLKKMTDMESKTADLKAKNAFLETSILTERQERHDLEHKVTNLSRLLTSCNANQQTQWNIQSLKNQQLMQTLSVLQFQQMNLNSSFQIQMQDRKQENRVLEDMFDIKFQNVTFNIESLFNESTDHLETLQDLVDEVTILQKDVGLVNGSTRAEELARNMSERSLEKLSKDVSNFTKQVQDVVSSVFNLERVKTSLDVRLMHIEQEQKVYFDVSFSDLITASVSNNDVLKYNDIRYNVGGGYNATTGNFTAPVNGVYLFLINGMNDWRGDGVKGFNTYLWLGEAIVAATTSSGTLSDSGTAFAILELSAGDSICVTINSILESGMLVGQYFTSFMGVKLSSLS